MTRNDATHDGDETATDHPKITRQYAFSVGEDGDDGSIEPTEESVETSLEAFGADVDHRERDTRIAEPEASSFGVDDRKTVTRSGSGEQRSLFADTDDDQRTLTGERAASRCLFGEDGESDTDDDSGEQASGPTASTDTNDEGQRAIADGGHVEDGDDAEGDESDESGSQSDDGSGRGSEGDDRSDRHERGASVESGDGSDEGDDTFDADAETVTEVWEGSYLSASWGYGQTNVELAQVVEVSDTGKSVLARFVEAETVGHGRTSEQLRPTAEQYGDEFRLQVRNIGGDPRFRGSYPLGNDGDMDGETRRGTFRPWNNDADETIRQTATGYGH